MDHHVTRLVLLVLLLRVFVSCILWASSSLPAFDSSASLILSDAWSKSLLRWDLFHFLHIAERGYVFEHEYAFFPGIPVPMHIGSRLLSIFGLKESTSSSLLAGGAIMGLVANIIAAVTLYYLTLQYYPRSPTFAYLTVLLSLLSSSPATLNHAPYAEPFFTCLSYLGMLCCAKKIFAIAAVAFALAGSFRSNGTTLAAFIIWGTIFEPLLANFRTHLSISFLLKRILYGGFLSAVVVAPFIFHQYNAYASFCSESAQAPRPWCHDRLPLVYTFVQSEYWNVGLFRYWTPQQLPNIILAVPVLLLLIHASISNIRHSLPKLLSAVLVDGTQNAPQAVPPFAEPSLSPSLLPHAIHALVMSLTLLFAAHTQIALRFASAMPFTYWAAASLVIRDRSASSKRETKESRQNGRTQWSTGYLWVGWSLIWGAISLVAWGVFLPPA